MRKVLLVLLGTGMLALADAGPACAQEKSPTFSLNAGFQTNVICGTSFNKVAFALDSRMGFSLGPHFEVSPEIMIVFSYTRLLGGSGGMILYPGAMLNYRARNFFVGAGAVLPWFFYGGEADNDRVSPKVNVGYVFPNRIQVTVYYLTISKEFIGLFDLGFAGVSVGYRF
jgi:hypothetical protein